MGAPRAVSGGRYFHPLQSVSDVAIDLAVSSTCTTERLLLRPSRYPVLGLEETACGIGMRIERLRPPAVEPGGLRSSTLLLSQLDVGRTCSTWPDALSEPPGRRVVQVYGRVPG